MKKTFPILSVIALLIIFTSCSEEYELDKAAYKLIPYSGKEVLILQSTENKLDTLFLNGIEQYFVNDNHLAFFTDQYEVRMLNYKKYAPYANRYVEVHPMIELTATSTETTIKFGFGYEYAFVGQMFYTKEAYDSIPITQLTIGNRTYKDVKVFEADDTYEPLENPIERFYWSLSQGLLGFDERETQWRLIKKYTP